MARAPPAALGKYIIVVTNEPEDQPETGGEAQDEETDEEADEERPTVAPPFDPVAFAKEVQGGKPSPPLGIPSIGPAAMGEPAPHRKTPLGMGRATYPTLTDPDELEAARQQSIDSAIPRRQTPRGLLSLANARIPSNLPPRNAGGGASDEDDREDELETRPPPPMQQELIDASSRDAPSSREAPPSTVNAQGLAALASADTAAAAEAAPSLPSAAPSAVPAPPSAQEMNDRVALGDYTGALQIAEQLLAVDPTDDPVRVCAESCRGILKQMYVARIGPLDRVPVVMVARDQLRWLTIDHRAGFVLSLVDGVSSVEMILDVSGMPEFDALRIVAELAQQRIVTFR